MWNYLSNDLGVLEYFLILAFALYSHDGKQYCYDERDWVNKLWNMREVEGGDKLHYSYNVRQYYSGNILAAIPFYIGICHREYDEDNAKHAADDSP